jgi:LacI family transcriptional regulator
MEPGQPPPRPKSLIAARVKDVAVLAGVSVGTVSNTLNRPELVSAEARERVLNAIDELGYMRNESARALRVGRTRTVGMIVPELWNPFFIDVAEGVNTLVDGMDATLLLSGSSNRLDRQTGHLETMHALRVQGILITPIDLEDEHLAAIVQQGTPVVVLGRHSLTSQFCSVFTDDVQGGYLACDHLLGLGHRRIAYVGSDSFPERLEGAKNAMVEAGLVPDVLEFRTQGSRRTEDGRSAGDAVAGMSVSQRPTAVMCGNDLLALGVLQALTSRGLRVPTDVAIVGYDDIGFAASAAVPITSIRQPRAELGSAAAELLFDEINNPERHRHRQLMFQPDLVVRASTGGSLASPRI